MGRTGERIRRFAGTAKSERLAAVGLSGVTIAPPPLPPPVAGPSDTMIPFTEAESYVCFDIHQEAFHGRPIAESPFSRIPP